MLIHRKDSKGLYLPGFLALKFEVERKIILIMDSRYGNYVVHTILEVSINFKHF